jgi:hypothetical protein
MVHARRLIPPVLIALAISFGAASCSKPDANPPVKITGQQDKALPTTSSTTTTGTSTTTTTLYYGTTP